MFLPILALDVSHARATLRVETVQAAAGKPFLAALEVDTDPHWHVYWRNPGDSGIPTKIEWRAPKGWRVEPLDYPVPRQFAPGGITAYGYEGKTLFLARVTPSGASGKLAASVKWLVCDNACVAGGATPVREVRVGRIERPGPDASLLRDAQARLPRPVPGWRFQAHQNVNLVLEATPPAGAVLPSGKPTFFPYETGLIDHAKPPVATFVDHRLVLRMELSPFPEKRTRVTGLLVAPSGTTWPGGQRSLVVNAPLVIRR